MNRSKIQSAALTIATLACAGQASSEEPWQLSLGAQGFGGGYHESVERRWIASAGFSFSADKPDRGGLSASYSSNWIDFYAPIADLHENSWFVGGRKYFFSDDGHTVTFRVDGYRIDNDDEFDDSTKVWAAAPQVSFLNANRTFYFDLGFAYSAYGDSSSTLDELFVTQVTPTVGFGSSALTDWIQLRGYFIRPSNEARAQNRESTAAIEAKYIHWFVGEPLGLYSLQAALLGGDRVYAVDPDVAAIYNLTDVQTGAISLSAQWHWFDNTSITTALGHDRYDNEFIGDKYARSFFYLGVTHTW